VPGRRKTTKEKKRERERRLETALVDGKPWYSALDMGEKSVELLLDDWKEKKQSWLVMHWLGSTRSNGGGESNMKSQEKIVRREKL